MVSEKILEKAEYFDKVIQERHNIEGLVLPTLVLPSVGRDDYQSGNFENCAIWTGEYVAAKALEYARTGDQRAREYAKGGVLALNRLQDITGQDGLVARGFKVGDEPTWDEDFFWKKRGDSTRQRSEWHQAGNYRWLGDTSKSQIFGVAFGYFAFNQFCDPTDVERDEMGKHFSKIVDRIGSSGGKIVDVDGRESGYGNYSPKQYFGFGGIGPFLMLSKLKLAGQLTGEKRFEDEYQRLLSEEDYSKFLGRCRLNPPVLKQLSTSFGSEDNLTMLNYYMLMNMEDDSGILQECRDGLERRWGVINDPRNSLFNFVYHSISKNETSDLRLGVEAMYDFPLEKRVSGVALKRRLPMSKLKLAKDVMLSSRMSTEDRPIDEYAWRVNPLRKDEWMADKEGVMEFTGVDFLIAANLGAYHRFL